GMAATFNDSLVHKIADAISTEARAKNNLSTAMGRHEQYMGLTFWSPNINIFRDPRWGRGQETYGEDPYLTGRMGSAFVRGLQGNDPKYLKTSAAAKHFVAHSGPEEGRHAFNSIVDEKDLRETYTPAFHKLVDAGVESVMSAYNRVNGEPTSASPTLMKLLRGEWGFKGHVVTDCGALEDIFDHHKVLPTRVAVAAAALKAGINLDCSTLMQNELMEAINKKMVTEKDLDNGLAPILRTQMKLGFFDPKSALPWKDYGADSVRSAYHIALARKAAVQSMVLLKNKNNVLPLNKKDYPKVLVVGSNAASADALLANYHGMSPNLVTFAEGITAAVGPANGVEYDMGSDYSDSTHFGGTWAASYSDVTIAVIGQTPQFEGEEGDAFLAKKGGDRPDMELPASHIAYMKALRKSVKNKPLIAVITAGSAVDVAKIEPYADAIILAWYPGEQGGNALADILFGDVSPSGKLPVTFYKSFDQLPDYSSYAMKGRTYRYFGGEVLYPFGYGLSYTQFSYSVKSGDEKTYGLKDSLRVSVQVKNTGKIKSDDVVQAYVKYPDGERMPLKELKAFKRISLDAGAEQPVELKIAVSDLQKWDLKKKGWKLYPGTYTVMVTGNPAEQPRTLTYRIK
ncbi:MAG: glycoside hydrolase family 3 C-terminal domain-containing protein, partial [Mucilaginibacter polytrichastri]|nr:glycoside hydrolase family 3 C-terminal domain-containing protein [Mucilaginibacter polytrichastri]